MSNTKLSFKERLVAFMQKYGYLFPAFLIPALIMWLMYIAMEVYPFGNNSVLVLDLNAQYVFYFEELRDMVLEGRSMLYTWSRSLGGEFMGIYAYYLASPFSFLITLFSKDHITEGLLLIFLLKTGLMGATMAYYLHAVKSVKPLNILIFSTCYALSSYAITMAHNTMWIDCLILLPLVTLGIERLITKKQFKLFVFSLAMCLLTSFYIGYMVCIYVALYFFYYYLAHDNGSEANFYLEENHFAKSFLRIVGYSAIAIAISMIIVYPAYTALQFGKSTFSNTVYSFTQRFDLIDFFAKLLPGSYDTVRPEGLPFVYCGVVALILCALYFLTSRIRWQERLMSGTLLCLFVLFFDVNAIDIVWHGFQKPNWLNYRYSFMFIFLLLVMAFKAFNHLKHANYKNVAFIVAILAALTAVVQKQDLKWIDDFSCIWLTLLCLAVYCVVLYFEHRKLLRGAATVVLLVLVCVELFAASLMNTIALDKDVVISTRDSYNNFMEKTQPIVDYVKSYDTSPFYRMEKTFHRNTNDPLALGYYGISNSTSTLNKNVIELLHKLGYASSSHWSQYSGGTPVTDALLGIKYVIDNGQRHNSVHTEIGHDEAHGYYAYQNPYALSLVFAANEAINDFNLSDHESPFVVMNGIVSGLLGEETNVFEVVKVKNIKLNNLDAGFSSGHRNYKKIDESKAGSIVFSLEVKAGYPVYMTIPTDYPKECDYKVNGILKGKVMGNKSDCTLYLGTFDTDQTITVSLELGAKNTNTLYMRTAEQYFYSLDLPTFRQAFNTLAEGNMKITSFEDDYFEGTVYVPEGQSLLYTTIPYDEGWIVTIDGKEAPLLRTTDTFLAVEISQGDHEVSFLYRPTCYTVGGAISIFGLIAFAAAIVLDEWNKRREMRRWAEEHLIF